MNERHKVKGKWIDFSKYISMNARRQKYHKRIIKSRFRNAVKRKQMCDKYIKTS